MTEKKFKLSKTPVIYYNHHPLYQIIAIKDFGEIKKGDLGGYVEFEDNLSHLGDCWIYKDGIVMGNTTIKGSAYINRGAVIWGNSLITGNSNISGETSIKDSIIVDSTIHHSKVIFSIVKRSEIVSSKINESLCRREILFNCLDEEC